MDKENIDRIVVSAAELQEIANKAVKRPNKDGQITPTVIRLFIELIQNSYGIDLGVETEEMKNEREAKENKRKRNGRTKLGRKQSNRPADDF